MAELTCSLEAADYAQLVAAQVSRLREEISQDVAYNSPFMNTIAGETIDLNGQGAQVRTLVNNRPVPAWSRTAPAFTDSRNVCGTKPDRDKIGQTEYTAIPGTLKGRGPNVCVNQSKHAVINSYRAAAEGLKEMIRELKDIDVRNQYLNLSGVKFVANSEASFNSNLTGQRKAVSTDFSGSVPDSPMSFKALQAVQAYAKETLGVQMFGSGADAHYKVIAGQGQIETFRNESQVLNAVLAQVQGGFSVGDKQIKTYSWEMIQHRGFQMAIDQQPLRFNSVDGDGFPVLIAPEIQSSGDYGYDSITNPDWDQAEYEVGFLMGQNAFKYLTPLSYVGEGTWKFNPQYAMGELRWHYAIDNECNEWGEFGWHLYRIERAIQPVNPHAVIPFTYKRCNTEQGLTPCFSECDLSL